jgi:putative ABC transport system substrate-binding protein
MPALATHLARWKVDVIVVSTTPAARAALRLTTLPVVLAPVSDPVGTGLAASLGRPGGNATGISVAMTDVTAKRLELLRLFLPRARRIACLINSSNPAGPLQFEKAQAAARTLGVQLIKLDARSSAELENVLRAISQSGAEEVLITGDLLFYENKTKLFRAVTKARLPAIFPDKEFLDGNDSALMSYGPNVRDAARRAAAYVDKILRGSKPADLPIEEISKYELAVNLRAARAIGLQIPEQLLLSADQVIR